MRANVQNRASSVAKIVDVLVPLARIKTFGRLHDLHEVGAGGLGGEVVEIRDHRIAAVAEQVDDPPISLLAQMVGLEDGWRQVAPVVALEMDVRHEVVDQRVRCETHVDAEQECGDEMLEPGVARFRIATHEDVVRQRLLDRMETGELRDLAVDEPANRRARVAGEPMAQIMKAVSH